MNAFSEQKFLDDAADADMHDEFVFERAEKLMEAGEQFDPLAVDNFEIALAENLERFPSLNLPQDLATALRDGKSTNDILLAMSKDYWLPKAVEQAASDLEQEADDAAYDDAESRALSRAYDCDH